MSSSCYSRRHTAIEEVGTVAVALTREIRRKVHTDVLCDGATPVQIGVQRIVIAIVDPRVTAKRLPQSRLITDIGPPVALRPNSVSCEPFKTSTCSMLLNDSRDDAELPMEMLSTYVETGVPVAGPIALDPIPRMYGVA
jgi:hypothetical protein